MFTVLWLQPPSRKISQVVAYSIPSDVVISSPQASTAPTFSRELRNLGDQRPLYLGFSLPLKEQPYGMPTAMMASLHPSMLVYSKNMMATSSPFNLYLASAFAMGNFGQLGQPPRSMRYFPSPGVLSLTKLSASHETVNGWKQPWYDPYDYTADKQHV